MGSLNWFWETAIGKAIWNLWRMFFNDDSGASMRKVLAGNFGLLINWLAIAHTDNTNLVMVLGVLSTLIFTLLGLVAYTNIKKDEKRNPDTDSSPAT